MTVGYRIKGKKGKLVPLDSKTPHRCVILAFDPALKSGWCIAALGKFVQSGEIDERDQLFDQQLTNIILAAHNLAGLGMFPCVLVREKPFAKNPEVVATLYRVRRKLGDTWTDIMSGGHAGKKVDSYPQTWRSRILGQIKGHELPQLEAEAALEFAGLSKDGRGPDENAAICIAKWATNAGEIAKVIPQRFWGSSE